MIKLNRIGNKLGLAGAVGVLLAIGMVANQMITESKDRGRQRARHPVAAGGRQLALRAYRPAQDSARRQRRQAGEKRRRGRKDRGRPAALQGERGKGTGCGARNRPAPGYQGTAAEDQGLDGRLYRRRGRSRESADHAAGADRQALGRLGRMDQGRRGPAGFAGHGEAGQSPRYRTFAVSGRCQGERAAGGCLETRRHRRRQSGHRDGQDRGLAEGCFQQAARRGGRPRLAGRGLQPVLDRQALPGGQRGVCKDRAGEERHHRQPHGQGRGRCRRSDGGHRRRRATRMPRPPRTRSWPIPSAPTRST